jgi:hypothetical protein
MIALGLAVKTMAVPPTDRRWILFGGENPEEETPGLLMAENCLDNGDEFRIVLSVEVRDGE